LRAHGTDDLLATCHALIDSANERGGRDNITVLLLHIE
jgi:serine/threonine protein phosphatase PrpC